MLWHFFGAMHHQILEFLPPRRAAADRHSGRFASSGRIGWGYWEPASGWRAAGGPPPVLRPPPRGGGAVSSAPRRRATFPCWSFSARRCSERSCPRLPGPRPFEPASARLALVHRGNGALRLDRRRRISIASSRPPGGFGLREAPSAYPAGVLRGLRAGHRLERRRDPQHRHRWRLPGVSLSGAAALCRLALHRRRAGRRVFPGPAPACRFPAPAEPRGLRRRPPADRRQPGSHRLLLRDPDWRLAYADAARAFSGEPAEQGGRRCAGRELRFYGGEDSDDPAPCPWRRSNGSPSSRRSTTATTCCGPCASSRPPPGALRPDRGRPGPRPEEQRRRSGRRRPRPLPPR